MNQFEAVEHWYMHNIHKQDMINNHDAFSVVVLCSILSAKMIWNSFYLPNECKTWLFQHIVRLGYLTCCKTPLFSVVTTDVSNSVLKNMKKKTNICNKILQSRNDWLIMRKNLISWTKLTMEGKWVLRFLDKGKPTGLL